MGETFLTRYFQNKDATPMYQVFFSLTIGILLSPWSSGLFFLVIFSILYEIVYYLFTFGKPEYWQLQTRTAVLYGYFAGWIIGRTATGQEILTPGVPGSFLDVFSVENLL